MNRLLKHVIRITAPLRQGQDQRLGGRVPILLGATLGVAVTTLAAATGPAHAAGAPSAADGGSPWQLSYQGPDTGWSEFTSMAAISKGDAWAVGDRPGKNGIVAARWNGSAWHSISIPHAARFSAGASSVSASSAGNVWVFGEGVTTPSETFRWDGRHWHHVALPSGVSPMDPVVLGRRDVWLTSPGFGCAVQVWHWTGTWRMRQLHICVATGLAAASARDAWVVGLTRPVNGRALAYRWNGRRWHAVSLPHRRTYWRDPEIAMGPAGDVWIGLDQKNPSYPNQPGPGYLMHWTGKRWQTTPGTAFAETESGIAPDGRGGVWLGPDAHWSGHSWTDTTPDPGFSSDAYFFNTIARIPGTSRIWGAGEIMPASTWNPMIASYGPVP